MDQDSQIDARASAISSLPLPEIRGERTKEQIKKEVFAKAKQIKANLNLMPLDDINIIFNQGQKDSILQHIDNLYELLKSDDTKKVDLTYLKAYMYHQNVQNRNPSFFKRINDLSLS